MSGSSATSASICGARRARRRRSSSSRRRTLRIGSASRPHVQATTRDSWNCGSSGNRSSACIRCRAGGRCGSDGGAVGRLLMRQPRVFAEQPHPRAGAAGERMRCRVPRALELASAVRWSAAARRCTRSDPQSVPSRTRAGPRSARAEMPQPRRCAPRCCAGSALTHSGVSCTNRRRNGPRSGSAAAFATASS